MKQFRVSVFVDITFNVTYRTPFPKTDRLMSFKKITLPRQVFPVYV